MNDNTPYPRLGWSKIDYFAVGCALVTRPNLVDQLLSDADIEAALEAESHRLKTQQTGGER